MADTKNIVTPMVRLAFPALFEPKPVMKGDARLKYQATLVIKSADDLKPILALAEATWKAKFPGKPFPKIGRKGNPIHESDEMSDDVKGFPDGTFFIRASSKYAPGLVDRQRQDIIDPEQLYPGCYVRVELGAYAWEHNTGGRGVSLSLCNVQKLGDGERLDGRREAAEVFGEVGDDDFDTEAF
jgi:hypothetical protein